MKKNLSFWVLSTVATGVFGQAVTSEPAIYNDPTTEVKLIVNLNALDQTKDYVQNLITAADAGDDLYIWTWSPLEHPVNHPLANGTSDPAWKNSNEALKMTKEDHHVYSYTMTPTVFYGVPAVEVFDKDIKFLIKPKDGGGYGDPDRKSDDLVFEVNPPFSEKTVVYGFPSKVQEDDLFSITYDNYRETKVSMQNLSADEVYVFLEATLTDNTVLRPSTFFQVGSNPDLKMERVGDGIYEKVIIPRVFFSLGETQRIASIKAIAMKKVFISGSDRNDLDFVIQFGCE